MSRIVIALGGNALGETAMEQLKKCRVAAKAIVDLYSAGNELLIAHGNGPQVGQIRLSFETAYENKICDFIMPFPECTAMSQGYIGYHLQQSVREQLYIRNFSDTPVVTVLTQVIVDKTDPAFKNPTKPIGNFYDEATALSIMKATGNRYIEDSGRGWRRVVPSPKPIDIYETKTIKTLIDANHIVIVGGGGGIPIISKDSHYIGVDAVIDKDFTASKIAEIMDADTLIILTAVDHIYINFNKPNQETLHEITVSEAEKYIARGYFAPGSMLPKIQAACGFVRSGKNKTAIIGSLEKAAEALKGESGTRIVIR